MEKVKLEVEVPKETHELAEAIANVAVNVIQATRDGWQTGTDLPVVITSMVASLPQAVDGIDKVGDEIKDDAVGFGLAWTLAGEKVYDKIKELKESETE